MVRKRSHHTSGNNDTSIHTAADGDGNVRHVSDSQRGKKSSPIYCKNTEQSKVSWFKAIFLILTLLYSVSLYRDRYKLLSFPLACWIRQATTGLPNGWTPQQVERTSMMGKTCLITGANSGLGKESAYRLAKAGCQTFMACRSMNKCAEAKKSMISLDSDLDSKLILGELDLASLSSTRDFAFWFISKGVPLHVLMLNAGMTGPHKFTVDGIESVFQINHLGHFLLTKLLMNVVEHSAPARIIHVSSDAHHFSYIGGLRQTSDGLSLHSINQINGSNAAQAYAQAKLCNILFAKALARRYSSKKIYSNALHPGLVVTGFLNAVLVEHEYSEGVLNMVKWIHTKLEGFLISTGVCFDVQMGCMSQLYLAMSPEIEANNIHGQYFSPDARKSEAHVYANNLTLQEQLWSLSEKAVAPFIVKGST